MLPSRKDLRVSDAEREAVADFLKGHYTDGRLTDDELTERVDAAYEARRKSELLALIDDLPREPVPEPARRRGVPVRLVLMAVVSLVAMAMLVEAMPAEMAVVFLAFTVPVLTMFAVMLTPIALGALGLMWLVRAVRGPARHHALPAPRRQRWLA